MVRDHQEESSDGFMVSFEQHFLPLDSIEGMRSFEE